MFTRTHSLQDELDWLDSEGPVSPGLSTRLRAIAGEFDFVRRVQRPLPPGVPRRARGRRHARCWCRRPSGSRRSGLAIFQPVFRGVRAIMYNSFEERALIHALVGNEHVPGVVVGVGSMIPDAVDPTRARQKFGLRDPFVVYVGRIDANKGCAELFDYFHRVPRSRIEPTTLDLVLIGTPVMPIPEHPRIRHLGFVSDQDKFDVLAAAEALVMPSYLREPVDGGARSVGARPAGARERRVRCAAGSVPAQQRRAVL